MATLVFVPSVFSFFLGHFNMSPQIHLIGNQKTRSNSRAARDSAKQSIGFTQLLRSVSSPDKVDLPALLAIENARKSNSGSREESIHRVLNLALKATEEPHGSSSHSSREHSHANAGPGRAASRNDPSLPRSLTHNPGGRLYALLPWLLLLNLAMTTLVLVALVCILFHISI